MRGKSPKPLKQQLVLYNPQGNVPREERTTAALELMTCKLPEVVIVGPAGTGKSLALLHRTNAILSTYAGSRGLLVRKTRSSLTEAALATWERQVIPRNLAAYPDCQAIQRKIRQSYEYPNGSVLVVAGMDTPERVMSTEYDFVAVQEATELTEHDWELLLTRLRNGKLARAQPDGTVKKYHQIIADCNPVYPTHWLRRRMLDGKAKELISRHEDNPVFWDGKNWTTEGLDYLDKLERLSGARYLRLRKGLWAAAEGIVYPGFDPAKHHVKPFHIPRDWRRIRSIDFGFRHPFVCQWWAVDPDGKMYRYRLVYYSQRIVADHAKQIRNISGSEVFEASISDHDSEDRATLHREGIRTTPAFKAIRPGIDAVTDRLRDDRIFFFRDEELDGVQYGRVERDPVLSESGRPTSDIEEFDVYAYPPTKDSTHVGKEDPVKEFDDGCDTTRYAVAFVDDIARRRFKLRGGRVGKALKVA